MTIVSTSVLDRYRRGWSILWLATLLAAALFLSGCSKQEVYGNLTEAHANELVAALADAGITAEKTKTDEKWGVAVDQGDFAKAVETLRTAGLPRDDYESLGTVFKKEGFTSTPLEERARLNFGLSQELSRTISEIDGVVQARVHLTMPEADPLSREVKPSAASVFVKYRSGFDLRSQTGAIKSLVTNSIEGLSYDRVSVVMVPAKTIPPTKTANTGITVDSLLRGIAGLIGLIVLAFAGRALWRTRKAKAAQLPVTVEPGA
jgi:type III secretion protein J